MIKSFNEFMQQHSANPAISAEERPLYYHWCDGVDEDALEEFCEKNECEYDITVIKDFYDESLGESNVYGTTERLEVSIWKCMQ
jgi:hypothetical protein